MRPFRHVCRVAESHRRASEDAKLCILPCCAYGVVVCKSAVVAREMTAQLDAFVDTLGVSVPCSRHLRCISSMQPISMFRVAKYITGRCDHLCTPTLGTRGRPGVLIWSFSVCGLLLRDYKQKFAQHQVVCNVVCISKRP